MDLRCCRVVAHILPKFLPQDSKVNVDAYIGLVEHERWFTVTKLTIMTYNANARGGPILFAHCAHGSKIASVNAIQESERRQASVYS